MTGYEEVDRIVVLNIKHNILWYHPSIVQVVKLHSHLHLHLMTASPGHQGWGPGDMASPRHGSRRLSHNGHSDQRQTAGGGG